MSGFTGSYRIERSPAEMTAALTAALTPLGYRVVSQGEMGAQYKCPGLSPWALLLLLVPILGWGLLVVLALASPPARMLVVAYEQGGAVMRVDADDAEAAEMFRALAAA